ncbi:HNH endonuclease [uncultured Gilvimarinus sp.]|uniref:HNH endonuclease n=1 Tax=uncultured Gilvimarinus sp. TaxID=1689143 RepID=UPI0030DB6102
MICLVAVKPSRWCPKCRSVHIDKCPNAVAWERPVFKKSGRGGRPWRAKRHSVFERDGYQCCECRRVVTLHGALAGICDHIIPKAEGGTDDQDNLQTLCSMCSDLKTQQESLRGRGGFKP